MATGPLSGVVRLLRRDGAETDGQLLQSFLDHRDEAAFASLVHRHGPMVLGVCRRVLQDLHHAEDAFQATFLVLVRKADSIIPREMVGNWLYGVACRTARKARAMNAKQRARDQQAHDRSQPEPPQDEVWRDVQPLLDRELERLPDKYRVPVVLCDLEGKTRTEAARQLGWPEGTLSWRLASARTMLAKRLERRGLALSIGALALVLPRAASAGVPASLMDSTVQAAILSAAGPAATTGLISASVAALTEGVLKTMWWTRWKIVAVAALALTVLGTGAGIVSYHTLALPPDRNQAADSFLADEQAANEQRENPAGAERQREPRPAPAYQGRITALEEGKSLTLKSGARGEEAKKIDLKLTDQTKIEFAGALKDLIKKLKVGDAATVWLQPGVKDTAAIVQAQRSPDLSGKITAVSADEKLLTLEVPSRARGEGPTKVEIKLTEQTKKDFGRGDPDSKLKPDFLASVWLQEGSQDTAAAVQASRPRPDAAGEISAISEDGKVLTLQTRSRSGEVAKTEIKLAEATKIEISGTDKPDDKKLKVGFGVSVWLLEGSNTAAVVQAVAQRRGPDLAGAISAVSADGKVVTLEIRKRGEDGTKVEVKLTDKTKVEFAGAEKEEEKKLIVGYQAAVWLQEGSKDSAAVFVATKPAERGR